VGRRSRKRCRFGTNLFPSRRKRALFGHTIFARLPAMHELRHLAPTWRVRDDAVRVLWVAEQQWGVISRWQLVGCGLTSGTISRWIDHARLHRIHPGVYALGHRRLTTEGRLFAALLYAGHGALLSHATAAWWWGLLNAEPPAIHISIPKHRSSLPGVVLHRPLCLDGAKHRRLHLTTVPRTLLDYAATASRGEVRLALAEADYRRLLDLREVEHLLGRGLAGSAKLRRALARHLPQLALTRSRLERAFLALCEWAGLPLPEVNAKIGRMTVDALWRAERVIVELDGHDGHSSRAQIERDRRRELRLRAAGYTVIRYTWDQITKERELVAADLAARLGIPA
jgi:hypothetical protein